MTSGGSGGKWAVFGAVVGTVAALVGILQFALGVVDLGGGSGDGGTSARAESVGTQTPGGDAGGGGDPVEADEVEPGRDGGGDEVTPSTSSVADRCLVGRWKAAAFPTTEMLPDGTLRQLTVTGYAYVNYAPDGTGSFELDLATDYFDRGKKVSLRDSGIARFAYTTRNGRITYADDSSTVTRTTRENGVVVSTKEMDPIPDGGDYTCTSKTLTRQVNGALNLWNRQ
ncbi:hypothetical protein [Streptodolium elevatio]